MSVEGTALFESNLAALSARSKELADILVNVNPVLLEAGLARNGEATARAGSRWLHSSYDPSSEARRLADEAMATGADLVVVLGLGLGYAARAVLASGRQAVAIEVDPAWLSALFHMADLTDLLADARFALVLCPDGEGLASYLEFANPRSIAVIENKMMLGAYVESAARLREQLDRFMSKDAINQATLERFGRLWVRNIARNIGIVAGLPGVSSLAGIFTGLPALVVAAGPSLDDVLPVLPDMAERMVIVCVDTALRSVLRSGVRPDFIVVVDPQYWNARHLDRCDMSESVLVVEAAVWPSVLRFQTRRTVVCSSIYPLGRYIEKCLGQNKGSLGAGGSVATTAWDFARTLGCSPLYMAGLDLSFPGGKTHARASLFEQRSLGSGLRLRPASGDAFQAMRGGRPYLTPANDGAMVTSDKRLSLYAWWFSSRLATSPQAPTWNLSRHGLAIAGMPCASSKAVLDLPPLRSVIDARLDALGMSDSSVATHELEAILGQLVEDLDCVAALADEAIAVAEQSQVLDAASREASIRRLALIDEAVLASRARDVVGFLFASAAQAVGSPSRSFDESLRHTARLYRAVAESARWHADQILGRS
ncbi:MAG TPA: 6-hydroxymethylpterin diphosphokinase MptE-like protein [bacterium]|nr:6-hydroxymethylpterin diphosphokinase MptE-like protein [bacterium]